jgi:hypothetical protein
MVHAYFVDISNGSAITNATNRLSVSVRCPERPTVNTTSVTTVYDPLLGRWNMTFNPASFVQPRRNNPYSVIISFNWSASGKPFYVNQTASFTLEIVAAPTDRGELPPAHLLPLERGDWPGRELDR